MVQVNGETVIDLSTRVDPVMDVVTVGGRRVFPEGERQSWIYNKPPGLLCTRKDPEGRPTIFDRLKLPPTAQAVGRLDCDTRGLLILSTDGELIYQLTHPKFEVPREYRVLVSGKWTPVKTEMLQGGVEMREGGIGTANVLEVRQRDHLLFEIELLLRRGKKREIRYSMEALNMKVLDLQRLSYGGVELGDLPEGKMRKLDNQECQMLRDACDTDTGETSGTRPL